ncbi:MAG: DUF4097 family beta strand repeat protein [Planctomycetes bacterium]|nr:DUF4097 family beta strand repeat protein [Planctomycetota bacterium]
MRQLLLLAVVASLACSCQSTLATEEVHHFPGPVDTLHLQQRAGDVTVTMTPRTDVRVLSRSHHVASEAPSILLDMRDVTLEVGYTREPGIGSSYVDFDIELPSGATEVVARADSGDLELVDLFGDLDAHLGSGDLTATGLFARSVDVEAGSGDVELSFAAPPEWVSITTGSGDVEIALPGAGWTLLLKTGNGDIDVDPGMQGDSGERRVRITTGSGDIRVRSR